MTLITSEEKQMPVAPVGGEDDVAQYMRDIRQYPLLTAQEEKELAHRCAVGDAQAIKQMVNSNLRLVVSVAKEYAGRGVPLLDLIQEGSIGLLTAAKKFDPGLEYRFSTYATKWIRRGVTRALIDHGSQIRVPVHTTEKLRRVLAAQTALQQKLERPATAEEVAQACGMDPVQVEKLLGILPQLCSLDAPAGEDSTLGALLEDHRVPDPQEKLVRDELNRTMNELLAMLDSRQRRILRLHFGMEDGACYSLSQIAELLAVSKERVRQLERQAMDKLKTMGAEFGLEDFLDE